LDHFILAFNKGDKVIVSVRANNLGPHALVIDKIEDGLVFIRDPWPPGFGTSYSVNLDDFGTAFNGKFIIFKE
jgi:hypothetical protein